MATYVAYAVENHSENDWKHLLSHWPDVIPVPYRAETGISIPDVPVVLLCPENGYKVQGETSLMQFEHPTDALYVFGPDHIHFQPDMLEVTPDHRVFIPLDGYKEMYSWVAAGIVLYDRAVKCGQPNHRQPNAD